jgi:RNA polymerase-interacting CarD/CdnL/TRCF family regulator
VYAAHGVGRVAARERKLVAGAEREYIVIDLAEGLRVMLPVEEAAERLRAVVDDAGLRHVQRTLAEKPGVRDGSWTKRINESKTKLATGRAIDLAELVRDGARHELPDKAVPRLTHGERRLYLQARQLLVQEICSAQGIEQAEADEWVEAQIALPEESGG